MSLLAEEIKETARHCGFDLVGIAAAASPPGHPRFLDWLDAGYAGEMHYLERRREAYAHPEGVLPGVKSVIMLGMNYGGRESPPQEHTGRVSRYAWGGRDYHDLIRGRLKQLAATLHNAVPSCHTRGVVDTAPLLERDFARLAGLGWFGKNTVLINKYEGSWFFLAALLTDLELPADQPHHAAHCGTCTRCLDACPTNAFVAPGTLDARRCISYLTIELKGSMPAELRPGVGNWLFGCDVCQDVCPWNRKASPTREPAFEPQADLVSLDALQLLQMSEAEFKQKFRGTALARPGWVGLRRNAAVVLGNRGNEDAVPALIDALNDDSPTIRGTAAWALGQIGGDAAQQALRCRSQAETDSEVSQEIAAAVSSS